MGFLSSITGSGLLDAGVKLAGSYLGYKGQKKANETNLAIANQTNEMNYKIAQEANAQNYKMFQEQLAYNSPAEQKRMLLEAGYNPADLVSSQYQPVTAHANAATTGAPQVAAQVQNELAYFNQLGNISQGIAQIAQAKKANEEANNLKLQNETFLKKFGQEMELLGRQSEWQKIENDYRNQSNPINIEKLSSDLKLSQSEAAKKQLEYELLLKFGEKRADTEIRHLESQLQLWAEQKKTEITQQELNQALGKKAAAETNLAYVNAWYRQYIAPSEKAANEGVAASSQASARATNYSTDFERAIQDERVESLVYDIVQKQQNFQKTVAERYKLYEECKKIGLEMDWYEFDERTKNPISKWYAPTYKAGKNLQDLYEKGKKK